MIGSFQDAMRPSDIKPMESEKTIELPTNTEVPSISSLQKKLEAIFPKDTVENIDNEIPSLTISEKPIDNFVLLEDGTEIEIQGFSLEKSELGNGTFKLDDKGNLYMSEGKLLPDRIYELKGSIYTTDDQGRIVSCEAKPQHSPENPRDIDAQLDAGYEDRKDGDQGGHIVGRDLNGDSGIGNLVAMDSKINQSDYKRMENDIKSDLDEGKAVTMSAEISYVNDSKRPDRINITVNSDGKEKMYKFDNNLDGSLMDDVPEYGKKAVESELNDTNGQISSIKEVYDEDGDLTKTIVNITYTDAYCATHRTKVIID